MLKRRIAVLVAGIFFGTQAGMAADEQENSSAAENDQYVAVEPTQEAPASFEIAEVSYPVAASVNPVVANEPSVVTNRITVTAARSGAFPPSADDMVWTPLPAQARYFEQRTARIQTAMRGDTFPPSADDLAWKLLPAQVSYFDRKAARTNVSMYGSRSSDSIE